MSSPNGESSPFAARTRAPFPNAGVAPARAASPAATPVEKPAPKTEKKSALPLIAGSVVTLGLIGGAVWFFSARADAPVKETVETAAKSSAEAAATVAASVPMRDARADHALLAERGSGLAFDSAERAAIAAATLRAAAGANEEAVSAMGPLVSAKVEREYQARTAAWRGIKLEEHTTPAAQRLRLALAQADKAVREGVWAEAVAKRDEAIELIPAAQAEIATQLSSVAKAAAERGDAELATYFYERVIRLSPADEVARAHLFANKFKAGQTARLASGIELAYVPPGSFTRGSRAGEPGRGPDEDRTEITLRAGFFIGVTEVTQRQWDAVFGAGAAERTLRAARAPQASIGPELPMHSVRWDEAEAFCERLTELDGRRHRLPTEAEWEYACRAGTDTAFNTGTDGFSAQDANIDDGSQRARLAPAPAGSFGRANAWGLRDMHGNVWEWCADWSAPYPSGPQIDPRGPATEAIGRADLAMRVVRGGGWNAPASDARSANRWEYAPSVATAYIGFRVVQEPALVAP